MKLKLISNWSEQFVYDDKTPGIFAGRNRELNSLKSIIRANNSSSVLISSVRGIGKSSFVHKALDELHKENEKLYCPVFLNLGNTLDNKNHEPGSDQRNKDLIKAFIRGVALSKKLKDNEINELYKQSLGTFVKEEEASAKTESGSNTLGEFNIDIKKILEIIVLNLLTLGGLAISEAYWLRFLVVFIGLTSISVRTDLYKKTKAILYTRSKQTEDNDFEYLEIKFEEWLSKNRKRGIVFVIDELDKVDSGVALNTIKSLKNLFSRSFAHFLFIGDQHIFEITEEDRELDTDKAKYPTLFTHRIYLPTPNSDELREYLVAIFQAGSDLSEISNYLLFKARNDFFELKRLLFNLIQYDEVGQPFLDVNQIKKEDSNYEDIVSLYVFVDNAVKKELKTLKAYWKDNYALQRDYFKLLNEKLNQTFSISELSDNQLRLVKLLMRGSIVKEIPPIDEDSHTHFEWTREYRIEAANNLHPEEEDFIREYNDLVQQAGYLNNFQSGNLQLKYDQGYQVKENEDGFKITGISLYSLINKNKQLKAQLEDVEERIEVLVDDVRKALEEIKTVKKSLKDLYFEVMKNILDIILLTQEDFFKIENLDSDIHNIYGVVDSIPGLADFMRTSPFVVYGNSSKFKYVFVFKNVDDISSLLDSMDVVRNNKNLLFANVSKGSEYAREKVRYTEEVKYKNGKTKHVNRKVDNFDEYSIANLKDLPRVVSAIERFLR